MSPTTVSRRLTLHLDRQHPGWWEPEVFHGLADYLRSRGHRIDIEDTRAYPVRFSWFHRQRLVLDHYQAVLFDHDRGRFWALDCHDWPPPIDGSALHFAQDRKCLGVLKCQYRKDPRAARMYDKVRPWTYFELSPSRFQARLPDLRARPRAGRKIFFRGNLKWAERKPILEYLAAAEVVNPDPGRSKPYDAYLDELASAGIALGLEGLGALCHREIEAFGAGVPVLMPKLKSETHDPLIPDVHYIAVDCDAAVQPAEEVARRLVDRYHQVESQSELLREVAARARNWYDRNVRAPECFELTARLLGLAD